MPIQLPVHSFKAPLSLDALKGSVVNRAGVKPVAAHAVPPARQTYSSPLQIPAVNRPGFSESRSLAKEFPRLHTGVAPPEATSRAGNLPGTGNRRWDRYSNIGIVEFENSLLGAGTADGVRIFFNYNTATGAAQRSSNEQGVPVTVYNTNRTWTGNSSNYYVLQLQDEQAAQANATFDVTESPFDVVRTYNPENTD
jgi:hypothetical protein